MIDFESIMIGDLVTFTKDDPWCRFLWEEPDYGPKSLDVKFSTSSKDLLLVLDIQENENVLVCDYMGNCGWTRISLLRVLSRKYENR